MRLLIMILATWSISASLQAKDEDKESATILAVIDSYIAAINSNDADAYAALQISEGMTFAQIYEADGSVRLRPRSNDEWVKLIRDNKATYLERYWDPTLLIHRDIAMFWAPYSFDENGVRLHCGVDVFDLVKVDDNWKIANAMWTIEPDGCPEDN